MMSERRTGIVKWFNDSRRFGFIEVDGESQDIFVHHSAIEMGRFKSLNEGERVEFSVKQGAKGLPAAIQVRPQRQLYQVDFGDEELHRILLTDIADGILGG